MVGYEEMQMRNIGSLGATLIQRMPTGIRLSSARCVRARGYGPGVMHSTHHPKKAWVIRVTSTNLDKLPRYHFREQDKIIEKV